MPRQARQMFYVASVCAVTGLIGGDAFPFCRAPWIVATPDALALTRAVECHHRLLHRGNQVCPPGKVEKHKNRGEPVACHPILGRKRRYRS